MSEPAGVTTFFWHDYETFGSQPRRDRPAQFAGVRTDMELRELDAPATWFCRPPRDLLPDPEAVLLTGITPQRAVAAGLPEPVFAARIQAELGRRGTIGAGYNSIRFDDEVTRHLFWRNLMDPYAREYADGCSRWDLLDVMRCTWALRPEGIAWPTGEDGRPSFRLGLLAAANGLAHDAAHDALSDVRATIALARLVRARQPKLWGFALDLRHKENVRRQIGAGRPFLHVSGRYPVERGCMAVAWPLAPHPVNRNEVIVWDLAEDPGILARLDAPALRRRVFGGAAELADGEARLPIKTIHVNRAPIVVGNLGVLGPDGGRFAIDRATRRRRHACRTCRRSGPRPSPARPRRRPPTRKRISMAASSATRTGAGWRPCARSRRNAWPGPSPSTIRAWTNCCSGSAPGTSPTRWTRRSTRAGRGMSMPGSTRAPAASRRSRSSTRRSTRWPGPPPSATITGRWNCWRRWSTGPRRSPERRISSRTGALRRLSGPRGRSTRTRRSA
jgi:exonuclease I